MVDGPAGTDKRFWAALDPNDPAVQLWTLSKRVEDLTKEKEELEENHQKLEARVAAMEKAFTKGSGMLLILPFIGAAITFLYMNSGAIFRPWNTPR